MKTKYIVSYSYKIFTSSVVEAKDANQAIEHVKSVNPEISIESVFTTNSWDSED